jgi:PAS domain S-box-containing protein
MYLNNAVGSNTIFPGNGVEENFDIDMDPADLDLLLDDVDVDEQGIEGMGSAEIRINEEDDGSTLQEPEPQPDDLGVQKSATSAVTDFTRRRNWTQRILAEMQDILVVLSPDGKVLYSSPATKSITNYEPNDLYGRFLSELVHDDDQAAFIREFNESIATGHRLRYHFRFRKPSGEFVILEASGHAHMAREKTTLGTGNEGNRCEGFFLVCRPYPTTSNSLLDLFLEHKVENMRLNRRIADLKKEEDEELRAQQQWVSQSDNSGTISPDDEIDAFNSMPAGAAAAVTDQGMMLPPARPSVSTSAQSGYTSLMTLDSNVDTISRSDTSSVLDGIEMLTGLRYGEGERSRGLSTGERDGALFQEHGDVHHLSLSSEENDKKKRIKTTEEYVCTDCGTLASPEWRKGPSGPKTLCNACGCKLHYPSPEETCS